MNDEIAAVAADLVEALERQAADRAKDREAMVSAIVEAFGSIKIGAPSVTVQGSGAQGWKSLRVEIERDGGYGGAVKAMRVTREA